MRDCIACRDEEKIRRVMRCGMVWRDVHSQSICDSTMVRILDKSVK